MDGHRRGLTLLVLLGLTAASGASCPNMVQQISAPPLPRVLPPRPTLDQVVAAVNRNSSQIESFLATHATLTGPGFPPLRANVAFQRPRRFRLRADTAVTGSELDIGSNEELFWFWVKRNQPPAVYFCRHDEFAASDARRMLPLDPDWLADALGLFQFDPSLQHYGPEVLAGDMLKVTTVEPRPRGRLLKVTIVDAASGWVLQQHVYDAQRQLLVRAVATGHRRDPLTNLVMPTEVEIDCPAWQFSMRLNLGHVEINRLEEGRRELWAMPQYEGSPPVDLCNPSGRPPSFPGPSLQRVPAPVVSQRPYRRALSGRH